MDKKYELAKKQGLNWQVLMIEDAETEIKLLIKNEVLKQTSFKKINDKVKEIVKRVVDQIEREELKVVTERSLFVYATRVYYYLERTFRNLDRVRIWALASIIKGTQTYEQTRVVDKMMTEDVSKGFARAVPLDIYAKDYMQQVEERLKYLSKIVAKDDYTSKVSLRNVAEMQLRAEKHEREIGGLIDKGVKLVWIVPHANCSERCKPWQGKLYSLDGTYGKEDGIEYEPLENAMDVYQTTKSGKVYRNGCLTGFNCFDEQTEVLTNKGWRLFKDLDKSELIYTIDTKTKHTEWQKPVNYFEKDVDGKMIEFKSYTTNLIVTPDHNMLISTDRNPELRFKKANEVSLWDKQYAGEEYEGGLDYFRLGDRKIDGRLFCRLLGYYLGDGSIHCDSAIKISQTNNDSMWESLQELPFKMWRNKNYILVRDKELTQLFKNLGKCDTKYIFPEVKEMKKECLQELLKGMLFTDGYVTKTSFINGHMRKPHQSIFTTSSQLCADFCEIIMKCGYRPKVEERKTKGLWHKFKNGIYQNKFNLYNIRINYNVFAKYKEIKEIDYKGKVYCVEVPNHTLLVKRNGYIQWCGNCRHVLEPYKTGNEPIQIPASVVDRERKINDKQRYLERGVRAWKEKALMLKDINNEQYVLARNKAKEWNERYIQYSKDNKVPYYPSRVKILEDN